MISLFWVFLSCLSIFISVSLLYPMIIALFPIVMVLLQIHYYYLGEQLKEINAIEVIGLDFVYYKKGDKNEKIKCQNVFRM